MSITTWLLVGLTALALLMILVAVVKPDEPPTPKHARWVGEGGTIRLTPPTGPPSARAGVILPSEVFLVPELGEDEWRFPPYPGDR